MGVYTYIMVTGPDIDRPILQKVAQLHLDKLVEQEVLPCE
jgi:hypothetical protein